MRREESRLTGDLSPYTMSIGSLRLTVLIAAPYCLFSLLYIFLSTHFAARSSLTVGDLRQTELVKGSLFVLTSTTLLSGLLFWLFERLREREARLQAQRETLLAVGKQAAAGLLASSVAHDLRNLLMLTQVAIDELLQDKGLREKQRNRVKRLQDSFGKVARYTEHLAAASGQHLSSGVKEMDLCQVVSEAADLAGKHRKVKSCTLEMSLPHSLTLDIDASVLHRLLLNLLINAAEATKGRGRILVNLTEGDEGVRLAVHDDGPGIPEEARQRVLDPFYTTKRDGAGLGLLNLRLCTEIHGGSFSIEHSSLLGGTCVWISVPKVGEEGVIESSQKERNSGDLDAWPRPLEGRVGG